MTKAIRKIQLAPCRQQTTLVTGRFANTAARSSARLLALHWHLDPVSGRPTMHWAASGSKTARCLGIAR